MSKKMTNAGSLKEGKYVIVDDEPCKIHSIDVSKSGKHGHAKVRIICIGLFDGTKRSLTLPSHSQVEVPLIDKNNALVTAVMPKSVMLTDSSSFETFEIDMPEEELKSRLVEGASVEYWVVLGKRKIFNVKSA